MTYKNTTKMRVSKLIRKKIETDKVFRLNTAIALEVSERNVARLAESNSDNLTKAAAVLFYKSTGLTDEQIFEKQKVVKTH